MRRLDIPLSDEQLRQIFDTFDANGNETIEYGEFARELHMAGIDDEQEQEQEENEQDEQEEQEEVPASASKITYEIDDYDDDDEDYDDPPPAAELEESFGNLTMGVIVEEPMEEIEEITPRSPAGSPGPGAGAGAGAGAGNTSNRSSGSNPQPTEGDGGGGGDSSVLRDTEADLQYFVEEWRALDTDQANALSLKELAVLLQRLPVPMGVGKGGGVEELGELMTQLLASQEVPVVNGNVGFREVGLWMVKQLTVFSQQQEQAEAAAAAMGMGDEEYGQRDMGDDDQEEQPFEDEFDDDYAQQPAMQEEEEEEEDDGPVIIGTTLNSSLNRSGGHVSPAAMLQSPPVSPSRLPPGVRGPSPSPSKTSNRCEFLIKSRPFCGALAVAKLLLTHISLSQLLLILLTHRFPHVFDAQPARQPVALPCSCAIQCLRTRGGMGTATRHRRPQRCDTCPSF